ncbi:MAG TPA: hypothetical protein VGR00_14785 [Thermoanaerobaculia bacterium]|jgi:hypothetical protein|nr:hypothetical protein [Thermoanaerobaculia bacterium]
MSTQVALTAAAALAHGLSPVSIAVDTRESGMMVSEFPSKGCFLSLQGPPGGPLFFAVRDVTGSRRSLAEHVRAGETRDVVLGAEETLDVAGEKRTALLYFTGEQSAATVGCAVVVPAGEARILLDFGGGGARGSVKSCGELVRRRPFSRLIGSFRAE